MALIKLDQAYCHESDSVLTIYQVRDLHFDEDASFDARDAKFECPDEDCNAPLVGVNHARVKFKNTPHFRLLIGHKHSEACDYGNESNMKASDESKRKGTERNYKASYHPEVLLLERQPIPSGTGKPKKKRKAANPQTTVDASLSNSNSDNFSPHKTSCLEHVVEIWVSNDAEVLQDLPLTIGDKNKNYQNAFKNIKYFTDEEGLIYWGHVKSIKGYGKFKKYGKTYPKDYAITFEERPWFEGENRQISIYIQNELIENYRKRKIFRRWIDSLLDRGVSGVKCFLVGTYPTLKKVPAKTSTGSFYPLEVHLKNLDHLVLRLNEDGEERRF